MIRSGVCFSAQRNASAALAQSSATAGEQGRKEIPTFSQIARLVVLDVVVKDKAGHIVPGLSKEDFSVLEDGRAQPVRSFEGLEVHASGRRRDAHPTLLETIHLEWVVRGKALQGAAVAEAIQAAEPICPVWAMLKPGTAISTSFQVQEALIES